MMGIIIWTPGENVKKLLGVERVWKAEGKKKKRSVRMRLLYDGGNMAL